MQVCNKKGNGKETTKTKQSTNFTNEQGSKIQHAAFTAAGIYWFNVKTQSLRSLRTKQESHQRLISNIMQLVAHISQKLVHKI